MQLLTAYNQSSKVIGPAKQAGFNMRTFGVCFRVTCKWVFCKLVGSSMKFNGANVMKIAEKHHMYRYATLSFAEANSNWRTTGVDAYIGLDYRETRHYVDMWSISFKDSQGIRYENSVTTVLQTRDLIAAQTAYEQGPGQRAALIVYYTMDAHRTLVGGHVVGVMGNRFFDSNSGEYSIDPGFYAEEIANYIQGTLKPGQYVYRWNIFVLEVPFVA